MVESIVVRLSERELQFINQIVRHSRELTKDYTSCKHTLVHDSVISKCKRALDAIVKARTVYDKQIH